MENKLLLFVIGLTGVLLHILVELNKLNKSSNCTFSIRKYFQLEIFSILISIIVCVISAFAVDEIKGLQNLGGYIILPYIAIGYMGQSLLIFALGRANKIVNLNNKENEEAAKSVTNTEPTDNNN